MRVYCEVCDTDDIPETEGLQVAPGAWIDGDTTANDHLQIHHPGEWFEMDTTDPQRVVLRRDTRAHSEGAQA